MYCDNSHMLNLVQQNINMSPTRVELELTEQCNLICSFCYNSQKPVISGILERIISRLIDEGVLEIVLTGGEPMLHPQFKEILKLCCANFAKVMIQTNGTYITGEWAKLFSKMGVYGVNISLHGPEKVHEKLTKVEGSFTKAFVGLKNVVSKARNVNVASNFVLTKRNYIFVEDTMDLLYDVGVREFTFTRFTPTGIGKENADLLLSRDELNETLAIIVKKKNLMDGTKVVLANSMPMCGLDKKLEFLCECCNFGISRFYIDVDGNVMMCGMSRILIGNILKETFRDMKLRSELYKNHVLGLDLPNICKNCEHFDRCRGGCRAAAYTYTGKIDGIDPYSIHI